MLNKLNKFFKLFKRRPKKIDYDEEFNKEFKKELTYYLYDKDTNSGYNSDKYNR